MIKRTSSSVQHASRVVIMLLCTCVCVFVSTHRARAADDPPQEEQVDSVRFRMFLHQAGDQLGSDPDSAFVLCMRARAIANTTGRVGDVGEAEGWLGYVEEQRGHIEQALGHYAVSLSEAERLKDRQGMAAVLNNLAAIYKDQGRLEDALAAHERSLAIRKVLNDTSGIATSLNNIGLLLYDQGRIPEAMENYAEALRKYEAVGEQEGVATALHNIAGVYRDQGDHAEALAYLQRAYAAQEAVGDDYAMASTEDNMGGVLNDLGREVEALEHFEHALALHDSVNDTRGMGYSWRNISGIWLGRNDPGRALDAATRSHAMLLMSDDKRGQASALLAIGIALEASGRSADALEKGTTALAIARELGYPQLMRDAAQLMGRLHRARGQWAEAITMQDLYFTMRDSVLNEEARRSSIRQQYRYAFERKEADLKAEQFRKDGIAREELQKERNQRNVGIFTGFGLLLIAVGLWSRLRLVRRSREAIQKEKDVSENLLLNILPEEVAAELKAKGHADARNFDPATILFTDFTAIAEQLTPNELVGEIDACFKILDTITGHHRIEKIKTIGDAYMAVGGLPDPRHGSPADVVQAAIEMQERMKERTAERERAGLPAFHMRVGIHTGPVVAGIVGLRKFQYDIWGDAVNIASRMESSGEVGRVNISATTYSLVSNDPRFKFEARGTVSAKNKGELEMWFADRA